MPGWMVLAIVGIGFLAGGFCAAHAGSVMSPPSDRGIPDDSAWDTLAFSGIMAALAGVVILLISVGKFIAAL